MKSSYTFGVLGHRISYSRSPELFQAIAGIKNFTCDFVLHDIAVENFAADFQRVLKSGIDGFSVTIPHKTRIIEHLDQVDEVARRLGAVNSVCVKDGTAYGFNTDGYGFAVPLADYRDMLQGSTVLVYGAGGAAKAVTNCLLNDLGVRTVVVLGRNKGKLEAFAQSMNACCDKGGIKVLTLPEYDTIREDDYSMVVNCTPLGGWNHLDESPFSENFNWRQNQIYYDLSYNDQNKLVSLAASRRMIAIDGSAMLIGQALRSFYLWTGESVDFQPVYDAVFQKRRWS